MNAVNFNSADRYGAISSDEIHLSARRNADDGAGAALAAGRRLKEVCIGEEEGEGGNGTDGTKTETKTIREYVNIHARMVSVLLRAIC